MNKTEESLSLGIMQPYLFPYIGYFQLINSCEKFILYDDVQFIKGGWINRNRLLVNGQAKYFSLPIKKASTHLNINERFLSDNILPGKIKILNQISQAYQKAPYFSEVFEFISEIILYNENNLNNFIFNTIIRCCKFFKIDTEIVRSSELNYNRDLSGQERIIEINKNQGCTHYINAIGGKELYDKKTFHKNKIKLSFLATRPIIYKQFNNEFIANLSIIDVMMFNSKEVIQSYLSEFDLVD